MNGYQKGNQTEAEVIGILLTKGYSVALPIGVKRFDLLIEYPAGFIKAQIKTGRYEKKTPGCLTFNTATVHPVTGKRRPYLKEQVDTFLVYDPQTKLLYSVPFDVASRSKAQFSLRLTPKTENNQSKRIHYAETYRL